MVPEGYVDYLVIGGVRNGEVWSGPHTTSQLKIPSKNQPLAKFYSRDTEAEITTPLNDWYFITEYAHRNGKKYLIASTEPISHFSVDKEIDKADPPLTPIG